MKKDRISLIVTMVLFGSIGLFVRGINFTSSQIAMARGIIGCVCLLGISFLMKKPLSLKRIMANKVWLIASGIAIGLNWVFLFEAYKYTSISTATICYYFAPIFVMFVAPFLLKERLAGKKIICIIVAMVGMILITKNGNATSGGNELRGIVFGLMAAALYASVIVMNKFLKDISGVERTVVQLGVAALAIAPYTLLNDGIDFARGDMKSLALLVVVGIVHT
ncbi:MAG: DMT family transporter, partial [Clostridium sp.]|nr:DMT family transporter [Clostridium sp.]